jgi:DNA uptake protein ComE-like DNA-binding protein
MSAVTDVNAGTEPEPESLPMIGRRIIDGRPYWSVDDLDRVKGIGIERRPWLRVWETVNG